MFDPTIYENLKVVAEGAIYDLDLIGQILVTDRVDQVDLARLSRFYSITFRKATKGENSVHGALCIYVDVHDLASEIMEKADDTIGCNIEIVFTTKVHNIDNDCESINLILQNVWGNRPSITQQLSFIYDQDVNQLKNRIILNFDRKIAEAQVGDIPVMVDHMVESIDRLNELLSIKL
ncbi:hypothetical protein [Bacillus sp. Marseille-P3661]|uniref:hypothetical protein n=1 Tax=Bacillus sp. Marseille-P3661 TaxID=1936234 RepID=UPI000C862C8D|nr:hypothetical protein [Bacillus sp. Marseille-P3661]